ncbi:MAG: DUF3800 domain-containing protein [Anaerolineales bacterium]|nr:DUF3800 domain-containing protein [Anaerolineales bacterium]
MSAGPVSLRHYFVDEAGDGVLFGRRGQVRVGTPGCSRYFILGILDIPDPTGLMVGLNDLRQRLLADAYFKDVPSMQYEQKKTALAFHAKDDLPEVRREVFNLLRGVSDLRFFAVVADKISVVEYVHQHNARDAKYRYHPNELYDYLVRRLFKDRLHQDGAYQIHFARRGKADRTQALRDALQSARQRFYDKWGIQSVAPIHVLAASPAQSAGLQAADYFLWALQRLYERSEDRYVQYLWPAFRLVHDIDDKREAPYGVYYTQKKPLTLAAVKDR